MIHVTGQAGSDSLEHQLHPLSTKGWNGKSKQAKAEAEKERET